ncbi:MAG: M14 family metallopeptidase [Bacteriovoracaceae bacterium]
MLNTTSYFQETFEESTLAFKQAVVELNKLGLSLIPHSFPISSQSKLAVDTVYIPPASKKLGRLVILISGVHGIEGFTGSALQTKALKENFWGKLKDDDGILMIHSLNPYGFKNGRRVTENNVDLNRNLDTDENLFFNENSGYEAIDLLLNPKHPVQINPLTRILFFAQAMRNVLRHSMYSLRKAVVSGQYKKKEGLFFGGHQFEPAKKILESVLIKYGEGYRKILLIDLHTGFGERGKLHLFADQSQYIDSHILEQSFEGLSLEYGRKKDFYQVTGGLIIFAAKLFWKKAIFAGICFEFGTMDSHKTLGSLDSIYRMVKENQSHHFGVKSEHDLKTVQTQFREMFYPSSTLWRKQVEDAFEKAFSIALQND